MRDGPGVGASGLSPSASAAEPGYPPWRSASRRLRRLGIAGGSALALALCSCGAARTTEPAAPAAADRVEAGTGAQAAAPAAPAEPRQDHDRDGVVGERELCPDDAEDVDRFEDEDGCPDPDNDGDRIADSEDRCPNEAEVYNTVDDGDGCPDEARVVVRIAGTGPAPMDNIYFRSGSAQITQISEPVLDALAAALIEHAEVTLVEVQAHSDERGSDEDNVRLTRQRADAVLEALVARGVERGRLRAAGYGERCPVDPGHGEAAWERNRRVSLVVVSTVDGPTGNELICEAGRDLVPSGP